MGKIVFSHKVPDTNYRIHFEDMGKGYIELVLDTGEGLYPSLILFPHKPVPKGWSKFGSEHRYGIGLVFDKEVS